MVLTAGTVFAALFSFIGWHHWRKSSRSQHVESFTFPPAVRDRVKSAYPHLTDADTEKVMLGLREFFHISLTAKRQMVSMPSRVVDVAWHEFILFTKLYQDFCNKAFGHYLHHTPSEAMRSPTRAQEGIKLAWKLSCLREHMNPRDADHLPLLFAIDAALKIPDGFHYSLNCQGTSDYCASHIGCGSGCGSGGAGTGCSGDGSSGGDGGGCGGGD